ncbi:uncharacterized protein [Miscanthus floridulus]|uniref:uncharacterized protein isoform X1 n=1 Tax=Miscanthus floridulus TaxID=154761 RepID=UPI00345AFB64
MRTKHRNIVRFLGYCADTHGKIMKHEGKCVLAEVRVRLLCFEYIANGSLRSELKGTDTNCRLEWHERYRIIKGVCQGLRYLHEEKNIVHLDLKPDNILLDREMVPKITDFGLSRLFDKQQTRIITANCRGSRGYMAPEYLDNGVITFKSDIYSLGVIILEILTGQKERCNVENVVENWKNRLQATLSQLLLEAYCHQVKTCAEIALKCVHDNSQNRPDIGAIITMLNETETGFQEQETSTSCKLLEIHPLELRFPFELNRLATCPLYLANSTDDRIAFRLRPGNPERYFTEWLCGVVEPRSTYTLTVTMKEQKQHPPLDIDEFLIKQSRIMDSGQLKDINQGEADAEFDNFFEEVQKTCVDLVHENTLMALCDPQAETTSEVISTVIFDKMVSMDVHPTEPWIVTGHFNGHVCMWNYQTKAMVKSFELTREQEVLTVKFLAQKQWIVAGGGDGRIYVYSYNTMKRVKSFRALSNQITSLAIHPTEPYVLSASYDLVIKMWDWENGWKSTRKFEDAHSSSVMQIAFNPNDVKAFASVSKDYTLKIWSVDSPRANFTLAGHTSHVRCLDYFTRGDRQYLITGSDDGTAKIWNLQKKICVETLEGHANRVSAVCSHPELPILMTGSRDGTVRLWNSNSFRLEGVLNFGLRKVHALACMKDSRVVIGHSHGLAITEIGHHGRW